VARDERTRACFSESPHLRYHHSDLDEHTPAKLALLGELSRALENDELVLHYQPTIATSTGDLVGVEALVH
jgi:EAL domain-containing protein (putative c-di-GMP-specific phosphodiesterase class I)